MRSQTMTNEAVNIYNQLKAANKRSGTFHKGIFHLHTPASHDYRLFGSNDDKKLWNQYTEMEIYDQCCSISPYFKNAYPTLESTSDLNLDGIYSCNRECLAFFCLALKLLSLKLSYVVVTDHNNLNGSKKLQDAIDICLSGKKGSYLNVIRGIEISCADKVHVVVLYDHSDNSAEKRINKWLSENLISENEGVIRPSYDVLEQFIIKENLTAYIAHIYSSSIFDNSFLTPAYKKELFSFSDTCLIGVKSADHIHLVNQRVNFLLPDKECIYVLDNDSHSIDTLDQNYTYILGQSIDYKNLLMAFADYDVSVRFAELPNPPVSITGIGIPDSDSGFLHSSSNSKQNTFFINFSTGLNFLIGGRGSGKSTLVNIISLLLGGKSHDQALIELLCNHPTIYVLFSVNQKEYFSIFSQPVREYNGESFCAYLKRQTNENYYKDRNGGYYRYRRIYQYLRSKYVDLYYINNIEQKTWFHLSGAEKSAVLKKIFNSAYSINEILSYVKNDELPSFIADMLFGEQAIINTNDLPRLGNRKPASYLSIFIQWYEKKKEQVEAVVSEFNNNSHSTLRLTALNTIGNNEYASDLLPNCMISPEQRYYSFDISNGAILKYYQQLIDSIGLIPTLKLIIARNTNEILKMQEFYPDIHSRSRGIEQGSFSRETQVDILNRSFQDILSPNQNLQSCLQSYSNQLFKIQLEFNLSSNNENITAAPQYKNILELSMGQKVVAILSFILLLGDYKNDHTPLVIDQPEDNLDSQYIYENLVSSLRKAKSSRQVIIATHNPTLVTNCKAEQVVVLKSDNDHGWIEASGFPTNQKIANKILQYLEGGKRSFLHRSFIYSSQLKK